MDRIRRTRYQPLLPRLALRVSQGASEHPLDLLSKPIYLRVQAHATLFVRHHIVTRSEPDDLFRHLLQISNYHLEVRPLSSGRSGEVSGEVRCGFPLSNEQHIQTVLYRYPYT